MATKDDDTAALLKTTSDKSDPPSGGEAGAQNTSAAGAAPGGARGASSDPKVLTLAGQDPEAAAWAAHNQRRLLMKEKKKNKASVGNFLSNVGEIDADVNYRFTFTVVSSKAKQIVEATCNSGEAVRTGGGALSTKHGPGQLYRCMCEVTSPTKAGTIGSKSVAKLAFHVRSFEDEPPPCATRQDALSNAIVYALDISEKNKDGDSTFQEQLDKYQAALDRLRSTTRGKLRPVKALLLYSSTPDGVLPKSGLESWALQLADFEQERGDTWKFGPVSLTDDDALHQIFAEMTTARLEHSQLAADEPEEPALEEGDEPAFVPSAGGALLRRRDRMASTSSSASEQERPPCFGAEMDGSECSETAMEIHARTFGINVEDFRAQGSDASKE